MIIQLLSDIHFEWQRDDHGDHFISLLDPSNVDVLVLAGDIISAKYPEALMKLCDMYKNVLYVAGNHEFYGSSVHKTLERLHSLSHSNLKFLDRDVVEIEGKRFLGCTLWFDQQIVERAGVRETWLNDFTTIHGFKPWVYEEHKKDKKWLYDNCREGDVIITHHLPSYDCVAPKWQSSPYNCFFASNQMDTIAQKKPALWCFGHTHDSIDTKVHDTRLVCNPFGYYGYEVNHLWAGDFKIQI